MRRYLHRPRLALGLSGVILAALGAPTPFLGRLSPRASFASDALAAQRVARSTPRSSSTSLPTGLWVEGESPKVAEAVDRGSSETQEGPSGTVGGSRNRGLPDTAVSPSLASRDAAVRSGLLSSGSRAPPLPLL